MLFSLDLIEKLRHIYTLREIVNFISNEVIISYKYNTHLHKKDNLCKKIIGAVNWQQCPGEESLWHIVIFFKERLLFFEYY